MPNRLSTVPSSGPLKRPVPNATSARPVIPSPTPRKSAARRRFVLRVRATRELCTRTTFSHKPQRNLEALALREVRESPDEHEHAEDDQDEAKGDDGHLSHRCRSRLFLTETCSLYRPGERFRRPPKGCGRLPD